MWETSAYHRFTFMFWYHCTCTRLLFFVSADITTRTPPRAGSTEFRSISPGLVWQADSCVIRSYYFIYRDRCGMPMIVSHVLDGTRFRHAHYYLFLSRHSHTFEPSHRGLHPVSAACAGGRFDTILDFCVSSLRRGHEIFSVSFNFNG